MFQLLVLVAVLIPRVSTLKCMQCYSDSYEECKETQHPTECGKADDVCYSLTYSSKDVVHGSEVVNGGVKKGCTSECNKCDFYRFANKDCEIKCCQSDYCNVKKTVVFENKKKRSSSKNTNSASSSCQIGVLMVVISLLTTKTIIGRIR